MSKSIVSPYNLSFSKNLESSFNCLQLVSFLQRVSIQKDLSFANSVNIVIVEFAIIDFLRFTGSNGRYLYSLVKQGKVKFEKFEHRLCLDFITQFGKLLPLNYSYLDWLVYELRPLRKVKKELTESGMKIDYLVDKGFSTLSERKNFWKLLQFLNFVKELNYQTDSLGNTPYRLFRFPVQNFLEFTLKRHFLRGRNKSNIFMRGVVRLKCAISARFRRLELKLIKFR